MATPQGAVPQDLIQQIKILERQVRDLTAASLRRQQLGVTEGDFVVSGGGNVIIRDNGGVVVLFPESIVGAGNSVSSAYLGDLYFSSGPYAGTGIFVTDTENAPILNAATGSDGLRSSGLFEARAGQAVVSGTDYAIVEGIGGLFLKSSPAGQVQIGLDAANVYLGHSTTGSAANTRLETNGQLLRVTSSRRYKDAIQDADVDPAAVLQVSGRTWVDKGSAEDPEATRHVGFIAEELDEAGLGQFVDYDDEGRPDAIQYDRMSVALLALAKQQQNRMDQQADQIAALSARLDALEAAA